MSSYRIAMVGAGGIAQAYAEIVRRDDRLVPVGVFDTRDDAAEAWGAMAGTEAVGELDALLSRQADVVVIATPPSTHLALAARALAAGSHVLCEKPLATTRNEVLAVSALANDAERIVAMPAKFRFCADVLAAGELVNSGKIGDLRLIENAFTSRVDMSNRWNSNASVSGGGVIIDNGTHAFDLVSSLAGPIDSLLAVETARPRGMNVEDSATVFLKMASGLDARVDLSWSIDKSLSDFLKIYGSLGEIRVGWRESAWRLHGEPWQVLGPGYEKFAAMGGALMQFCQSTDRSQKPATGVREALAAATAVDASYESLRRRTWVPLAEFG